MLRVCFSLRAMFYSLNGRFVTRISTVDDYRTITVRSFLLDRVFCSFRRRQSSATAVAIFCAVTVLFVLEYALRRIPRIL